MITADVDVTALEMRAGEYPLARARAIAVTSLAEYEEASALLRLAREIEAAIEEQLAGPIRSAHATHRALLDLKRRLVGGLPDAMRHLAAAMSGWDREQERKAREIEEERRRRVEAERAEAELGALARAAALEAKGHAEAAEQVIAEAVAPKLSVSPKVPQAVPAADTVRARRWKAEVTDLAALVSSVANGLLPVECLTPVQPALDRIARERGAEGAMAPGVKIVAEYSYRARNGSGLALEDL